jgi:8-oxo-dGTP diphosphatase
MAHIHTQPGQYDFTVSAFVVRVDMAEPVLILHKHKILGNLLQFGGHIEIDTTPWQSIEDELRAESGYSLDQLKILQPKRRIKNLPGVILQPRDVVTIAHAFSEDHNHIDIEYAFVADGPPVSSVSEGESETIKTFTAEQLKALSNDETRPNIRKVGAYIFEECLTQWERVDTSEFSLLSPQFNS